MRDFERIDKLINEDEKLENAIRHEVQRLRIARTEFDKNGFYIKARVYETISNSLARILQEKYEVETKKELDQNLQNIVDNICKPNQQNNSEQQKEFKT